MNNLFYELHLMLYNHIVDNVALPKDKILCKASIVDQNNIDYQVVICVLLRKSLLIIVICMRACV